MRVGVVEGDDYVILFDGQDPPTEWHYEVEGDPFPDGMRHYLFVRITEFPDGGEGANIEGDVYDGTELVSNFLVGVDGPDLNVKRERRVFLSHLWVDPSYRRESIGSFFLDAFKAVAAFRGGEAAGQIGGGESTAEFLAAEGIPRHAITVPSAKRAKFSVDVAELIDNDPGMRVEDR